MRGMMGVVFVGLVLAGSAGASPAGSTTTVADVGYRFVESDGRGERVLSEGAASTLLGQALPIGFSSRQSSYPVEGEAVGAPCSRADARQFKAYSVLVDQTTEAGAVASATWSWCDSHQALQQQRVDNLEVRAGGESVTEWGIEGKRYRLTVTYVPR